MRRRMTFSSRVPIHSGAWPSFSCESDQSRNSAAGSLLQSAAVSSTWIFWIGDVRLAWLGAGLWVRLFYQRHSSHRVHRRRVSCWSFLTTTRQRSFDRCSSVYPRISFPRPFNLQEFLQMELILLIIYFSVNPMKYFVASSRCRLQQL